MLEIGEEKLIWKVTNFFTTEIKLPFFHFSQTQTVYPFKKKKKNLQNHNSNHSAPEWDFPFLHKIRGLKLLNTLLHPIPSLLTLPRRSVENCGNWVWTRDDGESLYRVRTFFFVSDMVGATYFIKVTLTSCWVINNIFLFILEIRIQFDKLNSYFKYK